MRIPRKIELGSLPVSFVSVYNPARRLQMKSAAEDRPLIFLDIEGPRPEFKVQKSPEFHLGVWGGFQNVRLRSDMVRPHIDIYVPVEAVIDVLLDHCELFNFYESCKKLRLSPEEIRFFARKKLTEVNGWENVPTAASSSRL